MKRFSRKFIGLAAALVALVSVLVTGTTTQFKRHNNTSAGNLEVHFIDIGQGDCTLLKCDGMTMLIDAGENDKGTKIQQYLISQGVERLDYLVLTHPDSDHIGGADVIVTKFDIGTVYMSYYTKNNKTYNDLINAIDYKRLKWITPDVGHTFEFGSADVTIIAPNKKYSNPNDASIGLLIRNGSNSFLFTGDAEEEAETDILANNMDIGADVLHLGHHGSKTSSSEKFLDAVSPKYAVISCGEGNSYGHPHAQTMNNLRSRHISVYRTDEQGSIIAVSNGSDITWSCSPSDTWQAGEPKGSKK